MRIGVVMPVGPDDAEAARCRDALASIRAWEPAVRWMVLVNDRAGRALAVDATVTLDHPMPSGGRTPDRVAAATLAGLRWLRDQTDADAVMKIDTDALVIAPFAEKLAAALDDPGVGIVGAYDRTPNGEPRDFRVWRKPVVASVLREPRLTPHLLAAVRHGYRPGEHVLGAAMGIPRHVLDRLPIDDPTRFARSTLWDDPLLAILVRGRGYRLANAVDDLFGTAWRGLPDSPERLLQRGYAIIHSVKNADVSESEIRARFAALRLT